MTRGENLKALREKKQISQSELAENFEVSQALIWAIENNRRNVNDKLKVKYSDFFDVSVEQLFFTKNNYK